MNKKVNIEISILFDDNTEINGIGSVDLWTGEVHVGKINIAKLEDMKEEGYKIDSRSISFKAGETTVVYDVEENDNNLKISTEERRELIEYVATFPESFTSPEPIQSTMLGGENTSVEENSIKLS